MSDGNRLNVTFTNFNIESHSSCSFDYVEISYGRFRQKYCGDTIPGPFISCSNITVKFRTDGSVTLSGYKAVWTELPDGEYIGRFIACFADICFAPFCIRISAEAIYQYKNYCR